MTSTILVHEDDHASHDNTCCICLDDMKCSFIQSTMTETKICSPCNRVHDEIGPVEKMKKKKKFLKRLKLQRSRKSQAHIQSDGDNSNDNVRVLDCGHKIHAKCYKNLKHSALEEEVSFKCPLCRQNLKVNKSIRREAKKKATEVLASSPFVVAVVFLLVIF